MRLGVGLNDRTRCRGVLNTPHRAPRHGANTRPRAFIHSGPGGPFGEAYAIRPYRGTCIRHVHSAPFGGVRWAYAVAPRGFAAQGFALGYGPPGLQPGRVRPIRALRPVEMLGPCGPLVCWCGYPCRGVLNTPPGRHHRWRIHVPGYDHSSLAGCLGGVCRCAPGFRHPGFRRPGFRPGL